MPVAELLDPHVYNYGLDGNEIVSKPQLSLVGAASTGSIDGIEYADFVDKAIQHSTEKNTPIVDAESVVRSGVEEVADYIRSMAETFPFLKRTGAGLFENKKFKDQVEYGVFQEGEAPSDRLRVRTEDGFEINLARSVKDAKPEDSFLRISYELAGVLTTVNISPLKKETTGAGRPSVLNFAEATVDFHRDGQPLRVGVLMDPKHAESLSGMLIGSTALPALQRA